MRSVDRMKRTAVLTLALSVALAPLPAGGQTRRAGGRARTTPPAPPAQGARPPAGPQQKGAPTTGAADQQVELIRSPKSRAMAEAFERGKLPEPARLPVGNADEQAAALAKAVGAGDSSSTAALYAAVLAAGFGVRDGDGAVLQTTARGQGLAFDAWEVAATSKLYGEGYGVGLGHLGESFTRGVPEFNGVPLTNILLEGIRAGARSEHPSVRFWARFIVELGRHSKTPYDLLGQTDATKVRLDAVQIALILKRLAGDLAVLERRGQQARSTPDLREDAGWQRAASYRMASYSDGGDDIQSDRVSFVRAGMRRDGGGSMRTPRTTQSPCNFNELDSVILDYNALGMTTAFGQLADRLGVRGLEKYGKAASIVNLILTVFKFIASYALLKTEITIDGHPLERTQNTQAGKQRTLSARLQMDSDKWQMLNCFRPALNAAGLDFNLPGSGPVKDVNVEWKLVLGGDDRSVLSTLSESDAMRILSAAAESFFTGNPAERIENTNIERAGYGEAIASLESLPGADPSPAKQRTGDDGVSRIKVIGAPQKRDLSREKLTKVDKVAGVRVDIQLKPMKIKDGINVASNSGDVAGNVIAFLTGDFLGGAVGTIAETLYRSNWYRSEPFYFLVRDWEPCAGLWQGTMTVTTWIERHMVDTAKAGSVKKYDLSYKFDATIKVEGRRATAAIEASEFLSTDQKSGYGRITYQRKESYQYSGDVRASVSVSSGRYDVGFELPRMMGTRQTSGSCERPAPYKCQQPTPTHEPVEFSDPRYMSSITGDVDPNRPNEINDTKTFGEPGNLQHRVTVNFKRCM